MITKYITAPKTTKESTAAVDQPHQKLSIHGFTHIFN